MHKGQRVAPLMLVLQSALQAHQDDVGVCSHGHVLAILRHSCSARPLQTDLRWGLLPASGQEGWQAAGADLACSQRALRS